MQANIQDVCYRNITLMLQYCYNLKNEQPQLVFEQKKLYICKYISNIAT
jgi:hypothetical protein